MQMLMIAFLAIALILILVLFFMNDKQMKVKAILAGFTACAAVVFVHFLRQVHISITTDGPVLALVISTVVFVFIAFLMIRVIIKK